MTNYPELYTLCEAPAGESSAIQIHDMLRNTNDRISDLTDRLQSKLSSIMSIPDPIVEGISKESPPMAPLFSSYRIEIEKINMCISQIHECIKLSEL